MYLGLDLGTSSLKALIVDDELRPHWVGEERYEIDLTPLQAQIQPETWWRACVEAVDRAPARLRDEIVAVGISGQMHGVVLCDERAVPVRDAVLWPDRRAADHLDAFRAVEAADPGVLGNPIVPGMPGPVLAWLAEHESDVVGRARCIVSPKDWLRARITGESPIVTDPSDASATLLYDVWRERWSSSVMERVGVDASRLPEVVGSSATAGSVSPEAGARLGLAPGTVVSVGAGDAAAALLGSGIEQPGSVLVNVGTGAQVLAVVDGPDARRADRGLHQFRTASESGGWYVMAPIVNAGLALTWVRSLLNLTWEQVYGHASDALDRYESDPRFAPFLAGERDPRVGLDARASWSNLSSEHDAAAMARSALLGVTTYIARRTLEVLELTGATRLVLSGGASRHRAWSELLADLVGVDVHLVSDMNSSARGAAITAARASGGALATVSVSEIVQPNARRRALVHSTGIGELLLDPLQKIV